MIKTENGNDTLTFEEFAEEVRRLVPEAEEESLREAYDQISARHVMFRGCASLSTFKPYTMRYIKEEKRHLFKVVYVRLAYDCGPDGWCPQDIPHEHLLINGESGVVFTDMGIAKWVSEQREKKGAEDGD